MKSFLSIIDSISEWSAKSTAFLVAAATVVVTHEVVLRYGFDAPTRWGLELTIFLCGAFYIMGYAYIHSLQEDVRVDVIYVRLTPRIRAIINLVTIPLLAIFFGTLLWAGAEWMWAAVIKGYTSGSLWNPPIWPMRLIIPLGAFIMLLQASANFIRNFNIAVKGKEL